MRSGELKINISGTGSAPYTDAYDTYGVWLESVSPFRQFAPLKERTENKSPLRNGKEVDPTPPMVDERDITLTMCIEASSESQFETRLGNFETLLRSGLLDIRIPTHNSKVYRVNYISCTQFTEFNGRLGKFILKLNEPNPADREERT